MLLLQFGWQQGCMEICSDPCFPSFWEYTQEGTQAFGRPPIYCSAVTRVLTRGIPVSTRYLGMPRAQAENQACRQRKRKASY